MCQHEQCRIYMSYLVTMLALLGSVVYSGYALSQEHSLLMDHDCKELPWANLAVAASSAMLAVSILIFLCWESMGCKRQITTLTIICYLLTNVWAFTVFWLMGNDCQKYYRKSHEKFWYMNLTQYVVLAFILLVMTFNVIMNCRKSRQVGISD